MKKAEDKPTYFYPTFNSQPSTPKPIQSFSPQPTPQPTTPQPIQTYSPTPTLSPIKDQTPQPSPAPLSPQPTSNVSPTPYSPQPSFTYSPRPSPQPTTTYSQQKSEVPTPITTIIYSLKPSSSAQPSYNQLDSQPSRKYREWLLTYLHFAIASSQSLCLICVIYPGFLTVPSVYTLLMNTIYLSLSTIFIMEFAFIQIKNVDMNNFFSVTS